VAKREAASEPSVTSDAFALANELIAETVQQAMSSPFYADLYRRSGVDPASVARLTDLPSLPIVEKEELRTAGSLALCDTGLTMSHLQHTSGTTGEPFLVHRSAEEAQFIQDFFTRLNQPRARNGTRAPLMLQVQFPDHGTSTPIPAHIFVVPFSVTSEPLVQNAILMLGKEFALPGVEPRASILSGSHTGLMVLTNYVVEREIDAGREFAIKLVHSEGRYLTARWRAVLQDVWGATISNKYSLAEVFGGASECLRCGGFHFDPFVVPEVVDLATREPIDEGTGALLLTSLYPFVQLQPMIRYWTGDLFDVRDAGCYAPTLRYRGRLNHALLDPNRADRPLLAGVDLIESLDQHPEVNRTIRFRDLVSVQYQQAGGEIKAHGIVTRARGTSEIRLIVELAFEPRLYRERTARLRERINQELMRSPALAGAVASGEATFDVEFARPGSLGSIDRFGDFWSEG
jgi:hypothetical protein